MPSLTGTKFIPFLKLAGLAFVISLHELLTSAQVRASVDFRYLEAYSAAVVYYLAIVSVLMVLQAYLERRFTWSSAGRRRRVVPAVPHDGRWPPSSCGGRRCTSRTTAWRCGGTCRSRSAGA